MDPTPLYVCTNCGRLAPLRDLNDDCTPGWTHGRLTKVTSLEPVRQRLDTYLEDFDCEVLSGTERASVIAEIMAPWTTA